MHSQGIGEFVCVDQYAIHSFYNVSFHSIRKRTSLSSNQLSMMEASHAFISATKEGPDYVCVSCNWLMYCKTVQEFQVSKYDRAPSEFVVSKSVRLQCKHCICKTCHNALKRGVLPAQAKANNLDPRQHST